MSAASLSPAPPDLPAGVDSIHLYMTQLGACCLNPNHQSFWRLAVQCQRNADAAVAACTRCPPEDVAQDLNKVCYCLAESRYRLADVMRVMCSLHEAQQRPQALPCLELHVQDGSWHDHLAVQDTRLVSNSAQTSPAFGELDQPPHGGARRQCAL